MLFLKVVALWLAALPAALAAATTLTVYTALEADQLKAYQSAFEAAHPDVKLQFVRDSTGIITAKLLAEKANPQADIVMGLAASSLLLLDKENLLLPYAPKGVSELNPRFVDTANPPRWVGMDVWGAAICVNTIEAEKHNLPPIKSWADLHHPAFHGKIVMPNPASSGTGYFDVTAWLQRFGEQDGWLFMDLLHQNIAQYTHSGSKPCKQAAAGEFPVGISFEYRAAKSKAEGAPLDIVFPAEGLGWDVEATGILKTTQKLDAAKKLADWAASLEANQLYAKNFAVVAHPKAKPSIPHIPENYESLLIEVDDYLGWAAENRERILAEWTKRYDGKSEPRK